MVKSFHSIALTLEEITPVILAKAKKEIDDSGITKPNALLQEQSFLDLKWKNPTLMLDGEPSLHLESKEGDPVVFLLLQRMHIEAEKSEAQGRHQIWPLSEAANSVPVDPHAELVSGALQLHCRIALPQLPSMLKDVKVVLHIKANPGDLKPSTDMGAAIPIPGIRDLIQKAFESKLRQAQTDSAEHKQVELTAVTDKINTLPDALKQCKIKDVKIITRKNPEGLVASAELEGDLSLLDQDIKP